MAYVIKEVRNLAGKAIHGFGLIHDGDKIAVGLSGGKDSLALVHLLAERQRRAPIELQVVPILVDLGLPDFRTDVLTRFCADLGLDLIVVPADWVPEELEECYPCARYRRQKIFRAADEAGCNLVALGHHLDDLIETLFMNLVYNSHLGTMKPKEEFMKGRFQVIRPLLLTPEAKLRTYATRLRLPVQPHNCPVGDNSGRAIVRDRIQGLLKIHKGVRRNIIRALIKADRGNLPPGFMEEVNY